MGDFNLNLLNYETHSDTNDFINSVISYSFLPYILHPTRVTEHSATIIDNIFSNITDCKSTSENILCQISDHFPQFIIVEKRTMNYKSCSFAKHDYSNFNEENFVDDYSSLDLQYVCFMIIMFLLIISLTPSMKICVVWLISMHQLGK